MNALIKVTTTEQGSQVVSARELYEYLGFDLSQWARWSKKNITSNQFAMQGVDFEQLDIVSNRGNGAKVAATDYALTMDFAERLSMLARTEKGEQIRRWFQSLKQKVESLPATQDELILMLAQRNVDTARRVSVLEQKIERIEQIQQQAEVELLALPAPSEPMVDMTPEAQIVRQVNTFSRAKSIGQQEVWRLVYQELYYRYRISVGSYKLDKGETKLQRLKKLGHIDKVLIVATNILRIDPVN